MPSWYGSADAAAIRHYARARAMGTDTDYKAEEWTTLLCFFGSCCLTCGSHDDLTVEHVIPLSQGGSNTISNLSVACRSCNSRKGTAIRDYRNLHDLVKLLDLVGHDE